MRGLLRLVLSKKFHKLNEKIFLDQEIFLLGEFEYGAKIFLISYPECANTEQFRTAGSLIKIKFDFYQLTEESYPGRLGEKLAKICSLLL